MTSEATSDQREVQVSGATPPEALRILRAELCQLVDAVPGPLVSASVRIADCVLEVTWGPAPESRYGAPVPLQIPEPSSSEEAGSVICAPLVGTFYVAPEPGAPPYVNVGDRVEVGQTVGIVEAMKLMNPVVADRPGVVRAVLVGNGEPVEFEQPLVRLADEEEQ